MIIRVNLKNFRGIRITLSVRVKCGAVEISSRGLLRTDADPWAIRKPRIDPHICGKSVYVKGFISCYWGKERLSKKCN